MSGYARWDAVDEELLCKLWDKEHRTARECAEVLGVTRNAVIGKVHRMKLARRPNPKLAALSKEKRRQNRAANQRRYKDKHPRPPVVRSKSNLPKIAAPLRSRKPLIVSLPVRNVNDSALIAGWLAQNGEPRKFERGATGDPSMMALWLRAQGYQVTMSITPNRPIKVIDPKGRHFNLSLSKFTDLVDGLRIEFGLEPILAREAA